MCRISRASQVAQEGTTSKTCNQSATWSVIILKLASDYEIFVEIRHVALSTALSTLGLPSGEDRLLQHFVSKLPPKHTPRQGKMVAQI